MSNGDFNTPDASAESTDELDINLGGPIRMTRLALPSSTNHPWPASCSSPPLLRLPPFRSTQRAHTVAPTLLSG